MTRTMSLRLMALLCLLLPCLAAADTTSREVFRENRGALYQIKIIDSAASDRTAIGMRPENMIKKCVVDGATNCSSLFNVTVYNTVERGNCFKLNSNGEVGEVRSGPFHGISLDIFLSRDEYPWIPTNDRVGML